MYVCMYVCMYACTYVCMYVDIYMCIYIYIYTHLSLSLSISLSLYIYVYTHIYSRLVWGVWAQDRMPAYACVPGRSRDPLDSRLSRDSSVKQTPRPNPIKLVQLAKALNACETRPEIPGKRVTSR